MSVSRTRPMPLTQRYWWLLAQGVCAIAFGIVAIVWPRLTFLVFLYIFGVYVIIEGLILAISALYQWRAPMAWQDSLTPAQPGSWVILLIEGLLSITAGVLCLLAPHFSAQIALYIVAIWALIVGVSLLVQAPEHGWLMAVAGTLGIIMGVFLFIEPLRFVQSILWLVGIVAIVMGVILIVRGGLSHPVHNTAPPQITNE